MSALAEHQSPQQRVRELWEELNSCRVPTGRTAEFHQRPEAQQLADALVRGHEPDLWAAAETARAAHAAHWLLLTDWLRAYESQKQLTFIHGLSGGGA